MVVFRGGFRCGFGATSLSFALVSFVPHASVPAAGLVPRPAAIPHAGSCPGSMCSKLFFGHAPANPTLVCRWLPPASLNLL